MKLMYEITAHILKGQFFLVLGRIYTSFPAVAKSQMASFVCSLTGFRLIMIYLYGGVM